MNDRLVILEAMDRIMRRAEDERVTMVWLGVGVPDWEDEETHQSDLVSIAEDDDMYKEVCGVFSDLVSQYRHRIFGRTT